MVPDSARPALVSFFLPLTRRTCAELGVGDDTVAAYLAEVLAEFARTDRLYRLRAPGGARLMSGLFRSFVERGGYLGYYLEEHRQPRPQQRPQPLDLAPEFGDAVRRDPGGDGSTSTPARLT
jgi:hypothetical protein